MGDLTGLAVTCGSSRWYCILLACSFSSLTSSGISGDKLAPSPESIRDVRLGDLRLSRSVIRKSRFIFTKEWRTVRQKSGCLNHLNEQIFQVNIQLQGWINDSWNGGS